MAHYNGFHTNLDVSPSLDNNQKINVTHSPDNLSGLGFNIPVMITGAAYDKNNREAKNIIVTAHLDTGASITAVDEKIAETLGLRPLGTNKLLTANGLREARNYFVNISFPNTNLRSYKIFVNDCKLPFNGNASDMNPQNFGVLLGRDIMSFWNIIWNGPSSTVFISD